MVTLVDYGMGNLGSIVNMLRFLRVSCEVTGDPSVVARAQRLILPGVGHFDHAMERLDSLGLVPVLTHKALEERVPVLGICLGMQLLTRGSDEGRRPGLGWLAADTRRFQGEGLRVPHMGWNRVQITQPAPLLEDLPPDPRFYFVHSYHVVADDPGLVFLTCRYGTDFPALIGNGHNLFGAQFHPEKSHRFGLRLLENFLGKVLPQPPLHAE